MPQSTFINQNLEDDYKVELIALLKEYVDCFAWNYTEMPGLSQELVEHQLPSKMDSSHISNTPADLILQFMTGLKKRLIGSCKRGLFSHAGMQNGSLILCLLRRKILGRSEFAFILEI
jgi:hypothetical protein